MPTPTIPTSPADVERALERTGNRWILDMGGRDALLRRVAIEIDEFILEYRRRFHLTPEPFALVDENAEEAAAFFELYTNSPVSMDMRIAVWELIHGADIQAVRFTYDWGRKPELVITLASDDEPEGIEYRGHTLDDFRVTRHFGILSIDGQEIFDGYYAFRPAGD